MLKVSIAGGSGYVGGELIRLLMGHPEFEVVSVSSERNMKLPLHRVHPHLRERSDLRFVSIESLEPADVLVLALPHGEAAGALSNFADLSDRILDCSADFRLNDPARYAATYGDYHPCPDQLPEFVYGLPEANRESLRGARRVSGVGCNATAINLALMPLVKAGLLDLSREVIADVKVGSSEAGRSATSTGQHAERSGVIRSYAPTGHRHGAEVEQVHGLSNLHLSVTAVDTVRAAMATVHTFPTTDLDERSIWSIYRDLVADEPFLRIVHDQRGSYRHPDPKFLTGTNFADLGWSYDKERGRLVALCAIDNLMKGAGGTAVQCLNLMFDFDERTGLDLPGIWPL